MNEQEIFEYLDQLLGQSICGIGRLSNMLWLGIGDIIKTKDRNGNEVSRGEIALHVQSTWRIVNKEKKKYCLLHLTFILLKVQ